MAGERSAACGSRKYIGPAGWSNGLYGADALRCDRSVLLVEGELDALTVRQHAGDLVTPVATGSTGGARRVMWLSRLAVCARVLVAFDSDPAGDEAAQYWLDALPNAARLRLLRARTLTNWRRRAGMCGPGLRRGWE